MKMVDSDVLFENAKLGSWLIGFDRQSMSTWTRGGGGQPKVDTCGQRGERGQNVQKCTDIL